MIEFRKIEGLGTGWYYRVERTLIGGLLDTYEAIRVHMKPEGPIDDSNVDYRIDEQGGDSTTARGAIEMLERTFPPDTMPRMRPAYQR